MFTVIQNEKEGKNGTVDTYVIESNGAEFVYYHRSLSHKRINATKYLLDVAYAE